MSRSFGERFAILRKSLNLSRLQLAKLIGIQSTAIDRIENEVSLPRTDVIQKVAGYLPNQMLWLLTGNVYPGTTQTSPDMQKETVFRIIDSVDPRFMDQMKIKSEFLDSLILLQSNEESTCLGGLLIIKDESLYSISHYPFIRQAIKINTGFINFDSSDTGKRNLEMLHDWLSSNRKDLLSTAKLKLVEHSVLDNLWKTLEVTDSELLDVEPATFVFSQFKKWLMNEKWWK